MKSDRWKNKRRESEFEKVKEKKPGIKRGEAKRKEMLARIKSVDLHDSEQLKNFEDDAWDI